MRQRRTIDPDADRPVYRQIADDLRDQIEQGHLQPGERLLGEARLAELYGHGMNSIRGALAVLRSEGLIVTVKGQGSHVRISLERTVVNVPYGADIHVRPATEEERHRLRLGDREPVVVIEHDGETEVLPAYAVRLRVGAVPEEST